MRVCTESCIQLRFINVNISQLAEKKKGIGPFSNSVISQSHIYPHPEECNAGFFEVNLSGGVYEAHGEDFSFKSFCLPVHSAGCVHLNDLDFGSALNHTRSSFIVSVRRVSRWEQKPSKTFPPACSSFSQGTKMAVIVPAQRL